MKNEKNRILYSFNICKYVKVQNTQLLDFIQITNSLSLYNSLLFGNIEPKENSS
jgi:hypothetical protein